MVAQTQTPNCDYCFEVGVPLSPACVAANPAVGEIVARDSACAQNWDPFCIVEYNDCYNEACGADNQQAINDIAETGGPGGLPINRTQILADCPATPQPTPRPTQRPTPLPSLPSNCYYLNLWSYYMRWTADGKLVEDQPPFRPNSAGDPPLIQHETQLFTPPEDISFATADCGLIYDNPCIVPVGAVNDGFGKVPVGKMIRNILSVQNDDCSNEDIGSSENYMTFLDPILNDELNIVQYRSSLASYAFHAEDKTTCNGSQIIPSFPITGGTVSKMDQTQLCL